MAKEKMAKISVNKFEKALTKEGFVSVKIDGAEEFEITVRKVLPFGEAMDFMSEIVTMCVDTESGEYIPEAYDMAVRMYTLIHYANFAMPSSIEKAYWLLYSTDVYGYVVDAVDVTQYAALIRAVDNKIAFLTDMIKSTAVYTMETLSARMESVVASAEKTFGSIDTETINKFADKVMENGKYDDKKAAKTIIAVDKFKGAADDWQN